jgi:hypothetical protein
VLVVDLGSERPFPALLGTLEHLLESRQVVLDGSISVFGRNDSSSLLFDLQD